jgi:hypothetical protein
VFSSGLFADGRIAKSALQQSQITMVQLPDKMCSNAQCQSHRYLRVTTHEDSAGSSVIQNGVRLP